MENPNCNILSGRTWPPNTPPQGRDRMFITCLPFQVVFWHLLHLTLTHILSWKQHFSLDFFSAHLTACPLLRSTTRQVTRPAEGSVAKQLIMALTAVAFCHALSWPQRFSQFFIFSRSGNKVFLSLRFATRVHPFAVLPQLLLAEKNQEKRKIKENP